MRENLKPQTRLEKSLRKNLSKGLNNGLQLALSHQAKQLKKSAYDPKPAQDHAFKNLQKNLADSEMSQTSSFDKIHSPAEFKKFQATDYQQIKPLIEKVLTQSSKRVGVFGNSPVIAIAQTSGTTSEPKNLPVTRDYISSYQSFMKRLNFSYCLNSENWESLFFGKRLLMVARSYVGDTPSGIPIGFITGLMAATAPKWMQALCLPSKKILEMKLWDQKMDLLIREAFPKNVTVLAGVPPVIMTFLQRVMEMYPIQKVQDVWPQLGIFVYGGMSIDSLKKQKIKQLLGSEPFYMETYSATEGNFGHTFDPQWPGMVFNPFHNFYQFKEIDFNKNTEEQIQHNEFLHLHELEAGKKYSIFITTPGGLINYNIGDVVEILSLKPLTFRIAGREKEEISLACEKITPDQIEKAIDVVQTQAHLRFEDYVVWPEEGRPHQLVFGYAGASTGIGATSGLGEALEAADRIEIFENALDQQLQTLNPTYKELRTNNFIYKKLQLKKLSKESFENYCKRNLDKGQFKAKRLFKTKEQFMKNFQGSN